MIGVFKVRLIDADELLKHAVESDRINGVVLVVGKGHIINAPTVETVKEGRWKGEGFGDYRCSLCDEVVSGQPNYCHNCGAKMTRTESV